MMVVAMFCVVFRLVLVKVYVVMFLWGFYLVMLVGMFIVMSISSVRGISLRVELVVLVV